MNAIETSSGPLTEGDLHLYETCIQKCEKLNAVLTEWLALVSVTTQRLHLFHEHRLIESYSISSALNGPGQKEGTGQTPLGLHVISEKIGQGADPLAVFVSRELTQEVVQLNSEKVAIVARILRLRGMEQGFNQGKDLEGNEVDSFNRYIYIHGTNDVQNIGKPVSAGCIRMTPDDVIRLFDQVPENTIVYIG